VRVALAIRQQTGSVQCVCAGEHAEPAAAAHAQQSSPPVRQQTRLHYGAGVVEKPSSILAQGVIHIRTHCLFARPARTAWNRGVTSLLVGSWHSKPDSRQQGKIGS
jgi:hypothetical protein